MSHQGTTRLCGEMAFSLSFPLRNSWKTTCLSGKAGMAFLGNKFLELLMSGAASGLKRGSVEASAAWISPVAAGYDSSDNQSTSFLYLQLGLNPASWLAIFCIYKQTFPSLCMPPTAAWEAHPAHRHCRVCSERKQSCSASPGVFIASVLRFWQLDESE